MVYIPNGKIVGMEALLRWAHPEQGLLVPPGFIAIAEETGLIVPMGQWVLNEACRRAKEWQERYPKDPGFLWLLTSPLVSCDTRNSLAKWRTP